MNDIVRILDKYKDIPSDMILTHSDLANDITIIQGAIKNASPEDKETANAFLRTLLKVIEDNIEFIQSSLSDQSVKIDTAQKNAEACIAYIKAKSE